MNQKKDMSATSSQAVPPDFHASTAESSTSSWPDDSTTSESADSFGRVSIEDELPNYVGGAHWAAILENVCFILGKCS